MTKRFDIAVVGAGAFGAWTAYWLHRAGKRVLLLDAYGAANSRASSGGESRITRMAYGDDEIYSRWALESLSDWLALEKRSGQKLFYKTGVLTFSDTKTQWVQKSVATIRRVGGGCEELSLDELKRRFPQIRFKATECAVYEPKSGAIMARRAVQLLVEELVREGVEYRQEAIGAPVEIEKLHIDADQYVFACGPWLPQLFPDLLGECLKPVRAEIFFLGTKRAEYAAPQMPTWIFMGDDNWDAYGMPDLENRGFKLAVDLIQQPADPETMDRCATEPYIRQMREFVAEHFPGLADAPIVETRVCQYENTATHDYLVDRHPRWENVWLVGGGSGHGFKNGPALGKYVAQALTKRVPLEPRLRLPLEEFRCECDSARHRA